MAEMDLESLEHAARAERREVLPLEYAIKRREQPPFDWGGTLRQFVFAAGVAFITGGTISWQGSYQAWRDGEVLWIAFGAFFFAFALPWPGRVGWKRS